MNAGALLFCYTPMMGVGVALIANYFGVNTILTSWDPNDQSTQMVSRKWEPRDCTGKMVNAHVVQEPLLQYHCF